jgi:hypothetical protein
MITTSTWEQCELIWNFNQKKYNVKKARHCVEHVDNLDCSNPKQFGHLRLDNRLNAQRRLRIDEQYPIKRIQRLESIVLTIFSNPFLDISIGTFFTCTILKHNVVLVTHCWIIMLTFSQVLLDHNVNTFSTFFFWWVKFC